MALVDSVIELNQHGIVHWNITLSNFAIFDNEGTVGFLKDLRFACSYKEKDKADKLPQSVFINKSKKCNGGSPNFDKFSIGMIIFSWYIGSGKCRITGKSK